MSEVLNDKGMPVHSPEFRARRTRNWMLLGLLYAFFYMTRYNFAASMGQISGTLGWTNIDLGWFEFVMPLIYGVSVVLNGPIADRIGGKKAFLFGAVGVTVMNFLFGACLALIVTPAVVTGSGHSAVLVTPPVLSGGINPKDLFWAMLVIWGINGYFQSVGALSIVKVNAQWFHRRERGLFSGIFGVLIRFGLILAFSGVPLILAFLPLSYAFWLPAACVAVLFVLNYFFMQDTPREAGLENIDTGDAQEVDDGKPVPLSYVLKKVFASKATWIIALASMMIGMVRRSTIDSWWPKYFNDVYGNAADGAQSIASSLPYQFTAWGIALMGIAGGFILGIASDRVYNGRRAPVITFGFIGMVVVLILFMLADRLNLGPWVAMASLATLSLFVNGSHGMIGGAASMDFGGPKAAATATGLFDGMQYLASAFVGPLMGYVIQTYGWTAWQWVPLPFAITGAILIATLWNTVPGKKSH